MKSKVIFGLFVSTLVLSATASALDKCPGTVEAQTAVLGENMLDGNYLGAVKASIPPRMEQAILASSPGLTSDDLYQQVSELFEEAFSVLTIENFSFDLDGRSDHELENGRQYAVIPTRTVMSFPDGRVVQVIEPTVALCDDNEIYLIRVSEPSQVLQLTASYPEFTGVQFEGQQVSLLNEGSQ